MKSLIAIPLSLIFMLSGCGNATKTQTITISSAISLQESLKVIEKEYERLNPNVDVVINYGGSGKLRGQIEQGAPVDIFFSANSKEMDLLLEKNLVDFDTKTDLLKNNIVLVASKDININSIYDLKEFDIKKIGTTDPNTAAIGEYTLDTLNYYGLLDDVFNKFVYATDVETVVKWIENGNAECGFVYKTNVYNNNKLNIVMEIPEEATIQVLYPVAIVSSSKEKNLSSDFINYLKSENSTNIFIENGFSMNQ